MPKEILRGFGGDVDAVAGWLAPMAARTPPTIFREASSPQVGSPRPLDRVGPAHADLCSDFLLARWRSNSPFSKPPIRPEFS